jgi:hypothetical protein
MDKYSIHLRKFGILLVLTKNPPNTIKGITSNGTKAIAISILGTITDIKSP